MKNGVLLILSLLIPSLAFGSDLPPSPNCSMVRGTYKEEGFIGRAANTEYCCARSGVLNHQLTSLLPSPCAGRTVSIKGNTCGCYTGYLGRELKKNASGMGTYPLDKAQKEFPTKDLKEGDIHPGDLAKFQANPQFFAANPSDIIMMEAAGTPGICCHKSKFSAPQK